MDLPLAPPEDSLVAVVTAAVEAMEGVAAAAAAPPEGSLVVVVTAAAAAMEVVVAAAARARVAAARVAVLGVTGARADSRLCRCRTLRC